MKTRMLAQGALVMGAAAAALTAAAPASAAVETIRLRSGWVGGAPGIPGALEDDIYFDPGATVFSGMMKGAAFTPWDFTDAQPSGNGVLAKVVSPFWGWLNKLPADGKARWIDFEEHANYAKKGAIGSALYAMPFTVNTATITSATLDLYWAVDDHLGDLANEPNPIGVYINGQPTNIFGGTFNTQSFASYTIPLTDIIGGGATNWIYFYQRDIGYQTSGLIFSATLKVVPAPGAGAVLGLGSVAALRRRRSRGGQ